MSKVSMKSRPKKKKKKRIKKAPYIIIIIFTLYFITRMPPLIQASSNGTYTVEYGKIEKTTEVTGYVVRDEKVFSSIGSGEVKYFVSEGEKVSKGEKLAEIYISDSDEDSRNELESINLRLGSMKEKRDSEGVFQGDIQKLESQIGKLVLSIQEDIKDEKYDRIDSKKKEINILLEKKSIIAGQKSFSGKNIEELEQQKARLEERIKSSIQVIHSDYPGYISLGSDGFEELLNYSSLTDLSLSKLDMLEKSNMKQVTNAVEEGTPVIRLVKTYKWSLVITMDADSATNIEKGKTVSIRPLNQDRLFSAKVRQVTEEEGKKIIILDLNEYIDGIYNTRKLTVDVIHSTYEGAMINNTSIVEVNDVQGVYYVDLNRFAKFLPIKIKISNNEYSIIHDDYFEKVSDADPEKKEKVSTVDLYDEVVLKGSKINAGQRVR